MRVAVLTHTFPPSRHSNAKRPFYVVRALLQAGWQVDVFSSRLAMEPDATETLTDPRLRIFRCADPVERWRRKLVPVPLLHKVFTLGVAGLMWPDYFAPWARRAWQALRAHAPYDRVLGFVLPASVLLGSRSPELVGQHWTFDYQESVTPQYRRQARRSPLQKWRLPRLANLEREALHQAAHVVFTAETNRRAYVAAGLAPERTTVHVPYFFDAEAFRRPAPTPDPGFHIAYFGTFDWRGARSPETFLKALSAFLQRHPKARPQTRFVFYGTWLAQHDSLVAQLGLESVVSINQSIAYETYVERLKRSPVLLLVVSSAHDLFMPSKIVDYFGAARPILAFVPPQSEMRQVLESAGLAETACGEFDQAGGTAALEKLWRRYQEGTLDVVQDKIRKWSSEVQLPRYLKLLSEAGETTGVLGV
ncbi:MAG TPA: hypothetical protein VG167_12545 [Verrucomicrobiae bacterium]|nr:hypothetical protein [Verrucomicrobiae bacterium]